MTTAIKADVMTLLGLEVDGPAVVTASGDADANDFPADMTLLEKVINRVSPDLLIDVNCWLGANACSIAEKMRAVNPDSAVLCLDTWLGDLDQWLRPAQRAKLGIFQGEGRANTYRRFLRYVKSRGCDDMIIPLPMGILQGFEFLRRKGVRGNVVFLEAQRDTIETLHQIEAAKSVLAPRGKLMGNGWTRVAVRSAVGKAALLFPSTIEEKEDIWWLKKKVDDPD